MARIGWYQIALPEITGEHGAVITGSFLGTLIILERTVTQKKKWLYHLPALSGISIFFFLAGFSMVANTLLSLASLGLVLLSTTSLELLSTVHYNKFHNCFKKNHLSLNSS